MRTSNKKNLLITCLAVFGIGVSLASCGNSEATIYNAITSSIYGSITNIQVNGEDYDSSATYSAGDTVTFSVEPTDYMLVTGATINNSAVSQVIGGEGYTYTGTLSSGRNTLSATFEIDKSVDLVDEFKLNLDEETFNAVMSDDSDYDFREDGVEEMNLDEYRYCVDGDTTHFTTKKEAYTVKVRYLGIDTPESSSVVEEWGKTASLFNKSILDEDEGTAKHVILQSQGRATDPDSEDPSVWVSETDNYNRNLAYVWYSTEENPTIDDFRCLNLEEMYMGLSQGLGSSLEEMGDYFYGFFTKAYLSAVANERNLYSGELDVNYYYDWHDEPQELTLKDLYTSSSTNSTIGYNTDSEYADNFTFYKIHGYVSRKVESSYYIQDAPSYDQSTTRTPEAYGIYVFSYSTNTLQVGDEVEVIGVISTYGGNYQMQGTSYNTLRPDENRDTRIISSGNTIVPIELTTEEFINAKYQNVLVKITDRLDSKLYENTYYNSTYNYGGVYEINTTGESSENNYTIKYPFYYDDNAIISYGLPYGEEDVSGNYVRIKVSDEILLYHDGQYSYSYKFLCGGTNLYSPNGAEYVYDNDNNELYQALYINNDESQGEVTYIETEYQARSFTSLTCISQPYVSTSGATRNMTLLIVSRGDVTLQYTSSLSD